MNDNKTVVYVCMSDDAEITDHASEVFRSFNENKYKILLRVDGWTKSIGIIEHLREIGYEDVDLVYSPIRRPAIDWGNIPSRWGLSKGEMLRNPDHPDMPSTEDFLPVADYDVLCVFAANTTKKLVDALSHDNNNKLIELVSTYDCSEEWASDTIIVRDNFLITAQPPVPKKHFTKEFDYIRTRRNYNEFINLIIKHEAGRIGVIGDAKVISVFPGGRFPDVLR